MDKDRGFPKQHENAILLGAEKSKLLEIWIAEEIDIGSLFVWIVIDNAKAYPSMARYTRGIIFQLIPTVSCDKVGAIWIL